MSTFISFLAEEGEVMLVFYDTVTLDTIYH